MRVAALLLLAAAAGFLIGRLTAPEERGRGGERRVPAVVTEAGEPPPVAATSRSEEAPATTEGIVQPSEPMDVDPGGATDDEPATQGLIEVDFAGFDGEAMAWTGWKTIRGGYEEYELCPDEGETVACYYLPPGSYDVWWHDRDGRRGTRAVVEVGRITRVRAADFRTPGPVPEGLGILDLEVEATWGGGLSCVVAIHGRGEEGAVATNSSGRGSTVLLPGRYTLEIGDRRDEVDVVAEQATSHRIAHRNEGDLVFDTGNERLDGGFGIARPGQALEQREPWSAWVDGGGRVGFVYVLPGDYDVFYTQVAYETLGVPVGRAVVHAGRTTRFPCHLPTGGLALRVIVPAEADSFVGIVIQKGVEHDESRRMNMQEHVIGHEVKREVVLAPGRYSVTAAAGRCEAKRVEIDVADRMVDLTLELARSQ